MQYRRADITGANYFFTANLKLIYGYLRFGVLDFLAGFQAYSNFTSDKLRGSMTIWISKLLGPVILALGVPMIVTPKSLQETTKKFMADSPLILISGVLAMTAGLSIINTHNIWVLDWPVIITLFGWALVVGGAFRIIAPRVVHRVSDEMMDRPSLTRGVGAFWGLLGLFLIYKGYF